MLTEENETETDIQQPRQNWLQRLSRAFLREPQNREELLQLLREARLRNLLDAESFAMIEGVMKVSGLQVRDIMIPRSQMIVIEQDSPLEQLLPLVIESGHSRFPVCGENRDDIIGILLAKDLLKFQHQTLIKSFNINEILRKPVFVPESKRVDNLLREFRMNHNHMALVVDEYGGIAGLVTIEDVLEQIVGEIEDEYDTEEDPDIRQVSEQTYLVKAQTLLEDFNETFHDHLSDEEYDTIGGYLSQHLGYLPKRGEIIQLAKYRIKVLTADQRCLKLLQVRVK